jgi:hypothetical protein
MGFAMNVYKAINSIQAELAKTGISKDSTNTFDNYKFRGIDAVYNALSPLLAKHGLCILPRMLSRDIQERQTQKGGTIFYVTVEAEFDLVCAEDGSKHTIRTYGEAMDRGDKATNKAMSAAYKYAAFQTFAIPTEGDNDADAHTHDVVPKSALSRKRESLVQDAADMAVELFQEGKEVAAYEAVSGISDNEEKLLLWSLLKPHSGLRSAIKRLADADRLSKADSQ